MLMPRFVVSMFSAGLMVVGAGAACGQDFPNKPVRIVTSGVGGAAISRRAASPKEFQVLWASL